MADLAVSFTGEDFEKLAEALVSRVGDHLEDRLAGMITERIETLYSMSGLWVPRLLKMDQLAHILQVPDSKARQMASSGNIPRLNLSDDPNGRTIRVDPRDLDAWLAAHQEFPARREELRDWMENSRKLYAIS